MLWSRLAADKEGEILDGCFCKVAENGNTQVKYKYAKIILKYSTYILLHSTTEH